MIAVRPRARVAQVREDARLGAGVDRRQRVVEQQQRRLGQQRARDRHALTLAAGQRDAALAHARVVAVGESASTSRVQVGHARDALDLARASRRRARARCCRRWSRRTGTAPAAPRRAPRATRQACSRRARVSPQRMRAGLRRIVAQQQVQQRRLAGAGRPDDAERAPRRQLRRLDVARRARATVRQSTDTRRSRPRTGSRLAAARRACRDRRPTAARAAPDRGAPTPPCRARSATAPSPRRTSARSAASRYMVNAVSGPIVISSCQTSQPPSASVSTVATVSVNPTAGSYAASHFCASKPAFAARSRRASRIRSPARSLEPERAQRAHGGHRLLHVLVQVGEAVERCAPRIVHVPRDHARTRSP